MLKNTLMLSTLLTLAIAGCNIKDPQSNNENIRKMEDTLFKRYPTLNRVSIEVEENENVHITLGDATLFNATDEKRQQVADEIGHISVHLFEKDNYLKKGNVIFVKEETMLEYTDKKEHDMHLEDALKNVGK